MNSADVLKFRKPTEEVKEKYIKMFMAGFTPSKAYNEFNSELQEIYNDQYHIVAANRALNPNVRWVYHAYYDVFKKEYGEASGEKMLQSLEEFVN